ncbi:MAG: YceI family protein [Flaviramulus sp.]|nr:YceI family protein [Flaviramulus sp.]
MQKLIFIFVIVSLNCFSQDKYLTKTGTVNFEASMPAFEEVKATNKSVTAIINTSNGEFAVLIFVKAFRFRNALMEEHFNENYAESDKYPKATFKGKIKNFSLEKLEISSEYKMDGELNFHGVTKNVSINLKLNKAEQKISLTGNLKVKVSDYNISVPKLVKNKVSENVDISFVFNLNSK